MTRKQQRIRTVCKIGLAITVFLAVLAASLTAYAVRANWGVRQQGPRLEKMGHHEDAAFYYRAALDFWTTLQQLWMEAVYDPQVDDIYQRYIRIFGTDHGFRGADHEEWQDNEEECLLFQNRDGAARNVEKGKFSAAARARLEDRLRVYIEDLMDPDHGFGGDFSFSRKARILERTGLFWHAALRRELAGRYAIMVCGRYCSAIAEEMERVFGDPERAKLYREKATWWRERGLEELRLSNGDRVLARIKGSDRDKRLDRPAVIAVLQQALRHESTDARRSAVQVLRDLDELALLKDAMRDTDAGIREKAAGVFAERALRGLAPGVRAEYFTDPRQTKPVAVKVLETVDLGMKLQANFPRVWYDYWPKPEVFPPNAKGPFLLRITGKLYVPADGEYRFYLKSDAPNQAGLSIATASGGKKQIISRRDEKKLQYVMQVGMPTHRIDFSEPVSLKKGLTDFVVDYRGNEVLKNHNEHMVRISGLQKAGIQLFWSSDRHLTELVPAENLFH